MSGLAEAIVTPRLIGGNLEMDPSQASILGFALPPEGVAIAVRNAGLSIGWLVCQPCAPAVGVSRDRRRTALVLADHLGLVLSQRGSHAA